MKVKVHPSFIKDIAELSAKDQKKLLHALETEELVTEEVDMAKMKTEEPKLYRELMQRYDETKEEPSA